jgi:4-amino-4-deoxy-L-arabinose transferase-like glycosyltransferase
MASTPSHLARGELVEPRALRSSFDGLRASVLPLACVLAVAAAVRFWGIGFGLPDVHARPDELLIVATALGFFTSNLNPHFFDYPALYIYILFALLVVYYAWSRLAGWSTSAAHFVGGTHGRWPMFYLIGRGVSAILGTLTVLWVYRIGRALFDRSIGLAAAIFLSLAFLHVRDSHYATTDVTMTLFVMCAMLSLVRLHQDRRSRHAWSAAIFAGLAMGTKYNAALLAVPMGVVELFHAWSQRRNLRAVVRETYLPLMAAVMLGTFLATSPYLLLDYPKALQDFRALQESMSVGMTPPELLGPGWIYHFRFSLVHGLGLPLLVTSLAGIGVAARRDPKAALLLGSFPVAYYLVAGASANVFVRYMIPIVPFLCLFAAVAVDAVSLAAARTTGLRQGLVGLVLVVAIVAPSAWSVFQFDRILAREDSRVMAAKWVMENVPFGSSVYTTGNMYGFPPLEDRINPKYRLIGYDYRGNNFIEKSRPFTESPDWIIVQRSALPYSHIPQRVLDMLPSEYRLVHVVRAVDLDTPGNVYDIQDAFYLPYGGFKGVRRPGPNLEIYQRR